MSIEHGQEEELIGVEVIEAVVSDGQEVILEEVIILEFAERGERPPKGKAYVVEIDGVRHRFHEAEPTGLEILAKVAKEPCRFRLVQIIRHHGEEAVVPEERVDLRRHGMERFRTEQRNPVTVFVEHEEKVIPAEVPIGAVMVATILRQAKVPTGFMLLGGCPIHAFDDNDPVEIEGCEEFVTQVTGGGSS